MGLPANALPLWAPETIRVLFQLASLPMWALLPGNLLSIQPLQVQPHTRNGPAEGLCRVAFHGAVSRVCLSALLLVPCTWSCLYSPIEFGAFHQGVGVPIPNEGPAVQTREAFWVIFLFPSNLWTGRVQGGGRGCERATPRQYSCKKKKAPFSKLQQGASP